MYVGQNKTLATVNQFNLVSDSQFYLIGSKPQMVKSENFAQNGIDHTS